MSRSARVVTFFGDGDHDFELLIGHCLELQELTDCGLQDTIDRIERFWVQDIKHVLRLGLIGGGMSKEEAARLVARNLVPGEIGACAVVALKVAGAAIAGPKDETLGELDGETAESPSPTARSDTPMSTAPEPPPASAPSKSIDARGGSSAPPSRGGPKPTARKAAAAKRRAPKSTPRS